MHLAVEIFRNDAFQHPVDGVVVDQNTAQDRHFCIEILGEFWVIHTDTSLALEAYCLRDVNKISNKT